MRGRKSHQRRSHLGFSALAAAVAACACSACHTAPARAADLFRDDFNGTALDTSQWGIGTWQIDRTWLGNTAGVGNGVATLTVDTYNAQHLGAFKGSEIWTKAQYVPGANGLEMEARVQVNPLPDGLVTSFFTYAARTQFNPPLADEIDFEHLSKQINAAPAGSKPILLTTWNDYKTDGSNFGDPNAHNSLAVTVPGWVPAQFNTYRIRWINNRVDWYVNDQLVRTAAQAAPNDPQNVRVNFWAPASEWTDAYSAALAPTTVAANNQTFKYNVDWVAIRNAYKPVSATGPNRTFTDRFKNGNAANSDSLTNFWVQRNIGASTVAETTGDPLKLTATGAGFPQAQLTSNVRSEFNFFNSPIRITADGIEFNSTSNSYAKSILRLALSSQALPSNSDSEYTVEDALSLRIQGDNQIALGYKVNQTNANSEFNTNLLSTSVSGQVRNIQLVLSPDFYKLTVEHELSSTDGTRVTDTFNGTLSLSMSDWQALGQSLTGNSAMFIESQLNNSVAGENATAMIDSLAVDAVRSSWQNDAGGNWSSTASWSSDGVPNFRGANAIFGNVITAPRTVTVDSPQTAGVLRFDSAQRYTLGGATVTMNSPAANASIDVITGSHTIAAPVQVAKDTIVTVTPAASTLTVSGGVRGAANLTKAGAGAAEVSLLDVGGLNVTAGRLKLLNTGAPVRSAVTSLNVSPGATLDVGGNALVIDYTGASPAAAVRSLLTTGLGGGTWNGTGLTSSNADGTHYAVGYGEASAMGGSIPPLFGSVDGTAVLVRWTRDGDANLDGTVDLTDFTYLATSFNGTGKAWLNGDFNYDGVVDLTDFTLLAANFNTTAGSADLGTTVPEPCAVALGVATMMLGRRRTRSSVSRVSNPC